MPIDRLLRNLKLKESDIFLVYGTKDEKFMLPHLELVADDQLLYYFLKKEGYRQILFLSPTATNGLYTLDKESLDLLNLSGEGGSQKKDNGIPNGFEMDDFFSQDEEKIPKSTSNNPKFKHDQLDKYGRYLTGRRDELTIIELLNLINLDSNLDRAIIFTDFDNMFTSPEDLQRGYMPRLQKLIPSWLIHNGDSKLKLFFLFHQSTEVGVVSKIQHENYTALQNYLTGEGQNARIKPEHRLYLAEPRKDEIDRLLQYHRLVRRVKVDWNKYDIICDTIINKGYKLNQWHNRLLNLSSIDSQALKENFNIEINSQQKSALGRLHELIGLERVKRNVQEMVDELRGMKRLGHVSTRNLNLMFTGNTGTGKTIVAELVAEIYREEKLLEGTKFTQVKASHLIDEHVGGSAKRTREICERALNGVLFIDEAYAIGESQFGKDVMAELIQYMLNERHRLAVFFAGYRKEMDKLFELNEGLKNRISKDNIFHFDDYSVEDLGRIFDLKISKEKFEITPEIRSVILHYTRREMKTKAKEFGNARGIENLILLLRRIWYSRGGINVKHLCERLEIDPNGADFSPQEKLDAFDELNGLIGLSEVKRTLRTLVKIVKRRKGRGVGKPNFHMVLQGNPGTGKSTVAKLVGQIFKDNGVLSSGHFVDASDIKGSFVGQSSDRMLEKIKEAQGGVLFIDEAYKFLDDQYGRDAINAMIAKMEEFAGQFLVMVAGYPDKMNAFLNFNEGMPSRFQHILDFKDFNPAELDQIASRFIQQFKLRFKEDARSKLRALLSHLFATRENKSWGNAREVRKLIELIEGNWVHRITQQKEVEENELVEAVDIPDLPSRQANTSTDQITEEEPQKINMYLIEQPLENVTVRDLKLGVVLITCYRGIQVTGTGTGFFINTKGDIVTAAHVIDNSDRIEIELQGKQKKIEMNLVYANTKVDFALLRAKNVAMEVPFYFRISSQAIDYEEGQEIALLGYPLGKQIVSTAGYYTGVINGIERKESKSYFLHNAEATHGISGGPIVKKKELSLIGWLKGGISNEHTRSASYNIGICASEIFNLPNLNIQLIKETQRKKTVNDYKNKVLLLQKDNFRQAEEELNKGLSAYGSNPKLLYFAGVFYWKYGFTLQGFEKAMQHFERLREIDVNYNKTRTILFLFYISSILNESKKAHIYLRKAELFLSTKQFNKLKAVHFSKKVNPEKSTERKEINEGEKGHSYQKLFGEYLGSENRISIQEPYLEQEYQLKNLFDFLILLPKGKNIDVITSLEKSNQEANQYLAQIIKKYGIGLNFTYKNKRNIHDRNIKIEYEIIIDLGRGLHFFDSFNNTDPFEFKIIDQTLREVKATNISFHLVQ